MKNSILSVFVCSLVLLGACVQERPPVSVVEFMENSRLLEATVVRCSQNRSKMKYEIECVNARDAVNRLAIAENRAKRQQIEAQSERKRQALRRAQEAVAESRRRTLEAQRLRKEAEYLGLFEQLPPAAETAQQSQQTSQQSPQENTPAAEILPSAPVTASDDEAPAAARDDGEAGSDLNSIREELRRRQENPE